MTVFNLKNHLQYASDNQQADEEDDADDPRDNFHMFLLVNLSAKDSMVVEKTAIRLPLSA
jgi:hypothetical protein